MMPRFPETDIPLSDDYGQKGWKEDGDNIARQWTLTTTLPTLAAQISS